MLYLKEVNFEDIEKEFEYISNTVADENGFGNGFYQISREDFEKKYLPFAIDVSNGKNLPEGWVAGTEYMLWDDDEIVGWFRIRHYLNENLAKGAGHIGYQIRPGHRGKHLATKGLALTIEKAWTIIPEDEIYMSVNKDNPASLKAQLNNGAYIHHEDEDHYYTRIKRR